MVVRFGRDIEVLEVLLSVEVNLSGLDFSILDVDLVSNKHDRNILADSC